MTRTIPSTSYLIHQQFMNNFLPQLLTTVLLVFSLSTTTRADDSIKVAFIADQGIYQPAQDVLSLIAKEGTDLLLIQGDLAYVENGADSWELNTNNALGADFPVLSLIGNHDGEEWPRYEQLINQRVNRVDALQCTDRPGVKANCRMGDLHIVQVSPGIFESDLVNPNDNYDTYITESFRNSDARWKICSWHKNQQLMQTGSKLNDTGWAVYEACLAAGAIVATGHEHAYSRTYLLESFERLQVIHRNEHMEIGPGRSFAFVSGLGGWQARPQVNDGDWWASIHTASQGATAGALFCDFGSVMASCYFKSINGGVIDQFTIGNGLADVFVETNLVNARPDNPVGLRISRYSEHTAELFWDRAPADIPIVSYEIRLDGNSINQLDATSTLISTPLDRSNHVLEVIAIDAQGRRSEPSAVVLSPAPQTTQAPDNVAFLPSQPGALRQAVYSDNTTEFFWERSTDNQSVVAYELNINDATQRIDALSLMSNSMIRGQGYSVSVRAIDNEGNFSSPAHIEFIQ